MTGATKLIWMLSMGGWTKTRVGWLLAPRADATTWTTPEAPGVHTLKYWFQLPAQAKPPGEMLRTPDGLLEPVAVVGVTE